MQGNAGFLTLVCLVVLAAPAVPAVAADADVAVVGGGGVSGGEDHEPAGVVAVGASLGFPHASKHRVQFDYLFHNVSRLQPEEDRHFLTGSYVRQARTGKARPFFQIGAGIIHQRFGVAGRPPDRTATDTSFAVVFGGGATIEVGESFFIRPEVRLYGHVGLTLTLLPGVAVGRRF